MFQHISFVVLIFIGLNCQSQTTESGNSDIEENQEVSGNIFINEYGQIELTKISDTSWQTRITNNDGFNFDTLLYTYPFTNITDFYDVDNNCIISNEENSFLLARYFNCSDSNLFSISVLEHINVNNGVLWVNSSPLISAMNYGRLGRESNMQTILYLAPFYKISQKVKISGKHISSKGLNSIGRVYLLNHDFENQQYYELEGKVSKELWPIDYYSTDESPQGIFGNDTSVKHYRIILNDIKDVTPEPFTYKGTTINISSGKAAISWEFADSEAYILDEHPLWTKEEELKNITVSGILIQNENGSVLKNWKIITD